MKKSIKKTVVGLITASTVLTSFCMPAFAQEMENPDSNVVEQYLLDAGYSPDFIESIDDTIKLRLYEGQYIHQSTETIYGVLTEDYQVMYTLSDDGAIVIDDENMKTFERLLQDEPMVERIIEFQEQDSDVSERLMEPSLDIQTIQEMPVEANLRSLKNWSADCVVSHKSYKSGVAKKELTYTWKWEYSPTWTLTDKVAVAWSGGFTADPDSIYWTYKKNVGYLGSGLTANQVNTNGYGYDDYEPNAGCAVGIDIKNTTPGTYDRYHAGSLSVSLTKATTEKTSESAVGSYYHTRVNPKLSLAFSKVGPSISVTAGSHYDKSPDSAASFWSTTSGKP